MGRVYNVHIIGGVVYVTEALSCVGPVKSISRLSSLDPAIERGGSLYTPYR